MLMACSLTREWPKYCGRIQIGSLEISVDSVAFLHLYTVPHIDVGVGHPMCFVWVYHLRCFYNLLGQRNLDFFQSSAWPAFGLSACG